MKVQSIPQPVPSPVIPPMPPTPLIKNVESKKKSEKIGLSQILENVGEIVISKNKIKIGDWSLKKD